MNITQQMVEALYWKLMPLISASEDGYYNKPKALETIRAVLEAALSQTEGALCGDCPPVGYPTDKTRCEPCPRTRPREQEGAALEMTETFYVAKQAGDAKFLRWLHDRLEFVHGENPDVDYMHRLRDFAAWFEGDPLKGAKAERDLAIKDRDNALKIANMNHAQWERAEARLAEMQRQRDIAVNLATARLLEVERLRVWS